jgi:hypothetical protein
MTDEIGQSKGDSGASCCEANRDRSETTAIPVGRLHHWWHMDARLGVVGRHHGNSRQLSVSSLVTSGAHYRLFTGVAC